MRAGFALVLFEDACLQVLHPSSQVGQGSSELGASWLREAQGEAALPRAAGGDSATL